MHPRHLGARRAPAAEGVQHELGLRMHGGHARAHRLQRRRALPPLRERKDTGVAREPLRRPSPQPLRLCSLEGLGPPLVQGPERAAQAYAVEGGAEPLGMARERSPSIVRAHEAQAHQPLERDADRTSPFESDHGRPQDGVEPGTELRRVPSSRRLAQPGEGCVPRLAGSTPLVVGRDQLDVREAAYRPSRQCAPRRVGAQKAERMG